MLFPGEKLLQFVILMELITKVIPPFILNGVLRLHDSTETGVTYLLILSLFLVLVSLSTISSYRRYSGH